MNQTFTALGIRKELVNKLKEQGLTTPTPVQEAAIPALLSGKDAIVQAQTGTGKTLSFALPILELVDPGKPYVQALIVAPTRELALQITTEVRRLAPTIGASVLPVYGGQDVDAQIRKLKGIPHIVIGTPGRMLDHLRRGTLELHRVSMLILDEADQMLHMGFLTEVEELIRHTPKNRQTMLFSATIPDPVRRLAANYMRNPEDVRIKGKQVTLEGTKQFVVETTDRAKQQTLFNMLNIYRPYLAVIFCRTKIRAKNLTEAMLDNGFNVDELHGDLSQAKREQVMRRFREADLQYLVATDVAARGLDVEGVTHIFNYDIPHDAETYIHRIGRTGRAGQKGVAITLMSPRDRGHLEAIENGIGNLLQRRTAAEFGVESGGGGRDLDAEPRGFAKGRKPMGAKPGGFRKASDSASRGGQGPSRSGGRPGTGGGGERPAGRGRSGAEPTGRSGGGRSANGPGSRGGRDYAPKGRPAPGGGPRKGPTSGGRSGTAASKGRTGGRRP